MSTTTIVPGNGSNADSAAQPKHERKSKKKPVKAGRTKKAAGKPKADRSNKKAEVIAMLKRAKGATLAEIMKATGRAYAENIRLAAVCGDPRSYTFDNSHRFELAAPDQVFPTREAVKLKFPIDARPRQSSGSRGSLFLDRPYSFANILPRLHFYLVADSPFWPARIGFMNGRHSLFRLTKRRSLSHPIQHYRILARLDER
jgi:hypothetical protein